MTNETKLKGSLVLTILVLLWSIVMWSNNIITIKIQEKTIDSLQVLNDSLNVELFPAEVELNRYRIAYDIFLERNPEAAKQYDEIISGETE